MRDVVGFQSSVMLCDVAHHHSAVVGNANQKPVGAVSCRRCSMRKFLIRFPLVRGVASVRHTIGAATTRAMDPWNLESDI